MRTTAILATAVGLLCLVSPASALAIRYASPTGLDSATCSQGDPCSLRTAIQGDGIANLPTAGEDVVVETGSYPTVVTDLSEGALNLNIHGEAGQPRPIINLSSNMSTSGRFLNSSGNLSDLEFDVTGGGEMNQSGGSMDRVFLLSGGNGGSLGCQCYGGTLTNSVFVATGASPGLGINSNGGSATMTYRNVTAYSEVAGTAALELLQGNTGGTFDFTFANVIALNGAGGTDIKVFDHAGSTIMLTFDNSNYRTLVPSGSPAPTVVDGPGGHQTALPIFTNSVGRDFSEQLGSPTIDAGLTDPLNGMLDFAGNPRTVGGATDIGAYEYVPPPPTPPTPPSTSTPATTPTTGACTRKLAAEAKKKKKKRGCAPKKKRKKK